jgi:hypothetical protein
MRRRLVLATHLQSTQYQLELIWSTWKCLANRWQRQRCLQTGNRSVGVQKDRMCHIDCLDSSCDCDLFRRTLCIYSGHAKCVGSMCARQPHAGHGRVGHRSSSRPISSQSVQIVFNGWGSCSYFALLDPSRLCISCPCSQGIRSS